MKQLPQQDNILVLPKESEKVTAGGIIIPDKAQEQSQIGTVLRVGPGTREETMTLQENMIVLFRRFSGVPVEHEGKDCLVMKQSDVLCVIEE